MEFPKLCKTQGPVQKFVHDGGAGVGDGPSAQREPSHNMGFLRGCPTTGLGLNPAVRHPAV